MVMPISKANIEAAGCCKGSRCQQDQAGGQREANRCNENDQPEYWIAVFVQTVEQDGEK